MPKAQATLAENSAISATRRVVGRPFLPGQSGNAGGRPRGLAALVRQKTKDGQQIVDFMIGVLQGKVRSARTQDRLQAAIWLADRAFGKPTTMMDSEMPVQPHSLHMCMVNVIQAQRDLEGREEVQEQNLDS